MACLGSAEVGTDGVVRLSFPVANVGDRAGDELVQVYAHDVVARSVRPARQLVAFRRVHLEPGRAARVSVEVPAGMLALWDPHDGWVVEPGVIELLVGASSADIRSQAEVVLTGPVHAAGPDRPLSSTVEVMPGPAGGTIVRAVLPLEAARV